MTTTQFHIHGVVVDLERYELRRDDERLMVEPKVFDALLFLLERRDRVVTKAELLEALWPPHVSESVLPRCITKLRKVLGDDPKAQRIIKTVHGRGYQLVAEPEQRASANSKPAVAATQPSEGFVGRAPLLARLAEQLAGCAEGRTRVCALVGEAGIGKSRTAREVMAWAAARGMATASAVCMSGEGTPAFWPWYQLLRAACGDAEVLVEGGSGQGPHARWLLFDEVTRRLAEAATPSGLTLLIDDLQWADEPSLRLLSFFVQHVVDAPLLVLVTSRPSDGDLLRRTLTAVARHPGGLRADLHGLDEAEVAALIALRTQQSDANLAQVVHARTLGNPFFVEELMRLDAAPEEVASGVPRTILAHASAQLGELSARARALLSLVAAHGGALDAALAYRSLGEDHAGALDEALATGMLVVTDESLTIRHDLLREAIYQALSTSERQRLHGRLGRALAQRSDDGQDHHAIVAGHLARAGESARSAAVDHMLRAADRALAMLAYEDAVRHYRRALELMHDLSGTSDADRARLTEVELSLAEAAWRAGQRDEARAMVEGIARDPDIPPELLARAALIHGGDVERQRVADEQQRRLLVRSLEALDDANDALRARLCARLSGLPPTAYDVDERRELAARGCRLARDAGDEQALAQALHAHIVALWGPDHHDDRRRAVDELAKLADRRHVLDDAAKAQDAKIVVLLARGEQLAARRALVVFEQLAARLRLPTHRFRVHWLHASCAITEGRFADAEAALVRAERVAEPLGDPMNSLLMTMLRGWMAYERGAWDSIGNALTAMGNYFPWADRVAKAVAPNLAWRRGESEAASALMAEVPLADLRGLPRDEHWLIVCALWSLTAVQVDDRQRAALLYELLRPHAAQNAYDDLLGTNLGSVSLYLGALAGTLGRYADALDHLREARARNLANEIRPGVLRAELEMARVHLRRGEADDLASCARLAGGCVERCRALGLNGHLAAAEALVTQAERRRR